jgi:hypothetical protein
VQLYGGIGLAEETAKLLEYEGTGWKDDRVVPDPIPQKMK